MKSEIHNLIILDESGSMNAYRKATIDGCNETLNTIRAAQEKFAETQEHTVSIYVFQTNPYVPSRYLIKEVPVAAVKDITEAKYSPCGSTPLYDAVGSTLVDLKATIEANPLSIGNVTIITDGMENSSTQYTHHQVARLISALKEIGWSINFIGANIDVQATASSLNIDNSLEFQQTEEGTREMFLKERRSRMAWADRTNRVFNKFQRMNGATPQDFRSDMSEANKDYFADRDDINS